MIQSLVVVGLRPRGQLLELGAGSVGPDQGAQAPILFLVPAVALQIQLSQERGRAELAFDPLPRYPVVVVCLIVDRRFLDVLDRNRDHQLIPRKASASKASSLPGEDASEGNSRSISVSIWSRR